jgi:stringent starvation protein B
VETESKNKYDLLLYLLEKGDAMVCLDARKEEVDVPKNHKGNASLSLVLNLNFRRTLEILEDGIYATLSFQGRPYKCVLPFNAVWAIFVPSFQEGQVWEDSIPEDVQFDPKLVAPSKPEKLVPTLKAVPDQKEDPEETEESTDEKPVLVKRDRSHLRIIK